MGTEGLVGWSVHQVDSSTSSAAAAVATLTIGFPDVDWAFLQSIYGWAALQYQAWARGNLTVHGNSTQTIVLHTDNVFEYRVDGISHCGGDLYAYRRAPLVLHMNPGTYKLEIRAVRDVRIMGGTGEPRIQMDLEACITSGALSVIDEKLLIPDIVDDKLASALASVPIRNESKQWIEIQAISSLDVCIQLTRMTSQCLLTMRKERLYCLHAAQQSIQTSSRAVKAIGVQHIYDRSPGYESNIEDRVYHRRFFCISLFHCKIS